MLCTQCDEKTIKQLNTSSNGEIIYAGMDAIPNIDASQIFESRSHALPDCTDHPVIFQRLATDQCIDLGDNLYVRAECGTSEAKLIYCNDPACTSCDTRTYPLDGKLVKLKCSCFAFFLITCC